MINFYHGCLLCETASNKKFWEEIIRLLSIHKPTVNNLVTVKHKNPNPLLSKAHQTIFNLNDFKITEAMGLKIIASRSH
jgi:hypothetical protein